MVSFNDLLEQLATKHENTIAALESRTVSLTNEIWSLRSALELSHPAAAATLHSDPSESLSVSPDMVRCQFAAPRAFQQEALHGTLKPIEDNDDVEEPLVKFFGEEVQAHLGFKVLWGKDSTDRPAIQRVDEDSAAHSRGICPGDILVAINGVATVGRAREDLLPLLRLRPLQIELVRRGAGISSNGVQKKDDMEESRSEGHPELQIDADVDKQALTNAWQGKPTAQCEQSNAHFLAASEEFEILQSTRSQRHMGVKALINSAPNDSEGSRMYDVLEGIAQDSDTCRILVARRFVKFASWLASIEEPPRSGYCHYFTESKAMFLISSLVIVSHALCVTVMSDWELQHVGVRAPVVFDIIEMAFLGFYVLELSLRLYVHGLYFFVGENSGWNLFDIFLVGLSGFDVATFVLNATSANDSGTNISFMRIFRLFKIAKILRTIRVIKVFRELYTMLESFARCFISMFWGMALMIFLLYIFSLVFAQGVAGFLSSAELPEDNLSNVMENFGSVSTSMLSLYMAVTGGNDWSAYYDVIRQTGSFYEVLFLLYTFFFVFALFNIMTGVFVERAMQASMPDRDEMIFEAQKKLQDQVEEFRDLCVKLDSDNSGKISQEEFKEHMKNPVMVSYMSTVGLELHDVQHFFRVVAGNEREVDIDRFVEGCMAMKGSATALDVHKQIYESRKIQHKLDSMTKMMFPETPNRKRGSDAERYLTWRSHSVLTNAA
eukprot:TRINITY_DN10569_c0_g3_i1.p1 TRINITY_DN10569_c0_g3~~TRINITY_DN10569_c0_g3_i1.p1  ORF type:complete len:721 (+),score=117.48 TRINITY_DN10569_c0_g3_i1:74-2236(+)